MNTLNLSAGCWFRPWIRMSYCVKNDTWGLHQYYMDEWDAIALDWTESYKEYWDEV